MGVIPVQQDAGRVGAGRSGDAPEQDRDLRFVDSDDVDAAQHDPLTLLLEADRGRLEKGVSVARRVVRLPHEADEGQVKGRGER